MYCTQCGTPRPDGATVCPGCGKPVPQFAAYAYNAPAAPGSVPNYLVQAILVTLCCCIPFGIPAIVYAAQVNAKLGRGDLAGAMESSRQARQWCWVAFIAGIVVGILGGLNGLQDVIKK